MPEKKSITVTVYGLASSQDGAIRYIGQTTKSLNVRLAWHLSWVAKRGDDSRRSRWIRSVLSHGHRVTIVSIEENAVLSEAEIRWIDHYKRSGIELVNTTLGGDPWIGTPKTPEHKAKISAALKGRKSPWTSERNRLGKGKPGHLSTPETRAKIGAAMKGKPKRGLAERNKQVEWTTERRAALSAARTGSTASAETKALLSKQRTGKPWTQARRDAWERRKAK